MRARESWCMGMDVRVNEAFIGTFGSISSDRKENKHFKLIKS